MLLASNLHVNQVFISTKTSISEDLPKSGLKRGSNQTRESSAWLLQLAYHLVH